MKITKTITIDKPAEQIWHLLANEFDKAHLWMDPIPHSFEIGDGAGPNGAPMEGRICHLSNNPNGAKAKEVITQFDEADMSLSFQITSVDVPAIVPLKQNNVQMQVKALSSNQSRVTWVARPQLKLFAYPFYPLLRLALPSVFGKLLKGLKTYSENNNLALAKA